jgi:hypothetical protein
MASLRRITIDIEPASRNNVIIPDKYDVTYTDGDEESGTRTRVNRTRAQVLSIIEKVINRAMSSFD